MKISLGIFLTAGILLNAAAAEYFVDYSSGKKGSPGTKEKPFSDTASAFPHLKPGDVVRILPCKFPIRDTIRIGELKGTAKKPIIIDCMNNTFIGSVPLKAKDWKEISPGLFCRKRALSTNMAARYYMIHKGKAIFMGRATKGIRNPEFKKTEDLKPGEWTLVDEDKGKKVPKHLFTFYLRNAAGEKTPVGQWEEPSKISGVAISAYCTKKTCGHTRCGKECTHSHCEHVQIRNMIVRHFWNDGYNIHGKVRNVHFEHIASVECGDDGLSAHEACEITVKEYLSLRNSTGICHIQQANCKHDNVYIEGTRGVDFYPCSQSSNTLTNACIIGNSPKGIDLNIQPPATVAMKDCNILNMNQNAVFACSKDFNGSFENVRVSDYKKVIQNKGITIESDGKILKQKIEAKRQAFFRSFNLK